MGEFEVDAIVAVHNDIRPIERAVGSILRGHEARVRAIVVAHNIDPDVIRAKLGPLADDERLELLHLADGIPSPAGPTNLGLDAATAPFITILGSDDELAPGSIDAWLAIQRATGAPMVMARIEAVTRGDISIPAVRNGVRSRGLDGVKDRLYYRSAPLGLVDRSVFGHLRMTEGLGAGVDQAFSAEVWFTGSNIAYAYDAPAYIGHEDGTDRVTFQPRRPREHFGYLDSIDQSEWFAALPRASRQAMAVKLLRIQVFDSIRAQVRAGVEVDAWRDELVEVAQRLEGWAPGSTRLLSRAQQGILELVARPSSTIADVEAAFAANANYRSLAVVLPRNPVLALHRQAPFRTMASVAIAKRRSARAHAKR